LSNDERTPSTLLRGVDRAAFATAFAVRLRQHGVPVGLTGIEDFANALDVTTPDSISRLYWAARIALVRRRSELATFDAVFEAVFVSAEFSIDRHIGPGQVPGSTREDVLLSVPRASADPSQGDGLPWATLPPVVSTSEDSDSDLGVPERLPSELEALTDLPFEELNEREMELLGRWLEEGLRTWPTRRSRRRAPGQGGRQVALRPTIARSRRTGWEPVELVRVHPVLKPRKVVMLCDVSQSMQPQIAAYFHLMRALTVVAGGEAFAFATTLTRLTPVLRHKSTTLAIEQATDKVADRFGGTRIATSVNSLLTSHHGNAVRGGIVVIGSDGWDSEPPEQLAVAMARLRRRAHRLIWINPRVSAPGFEPLVGTMAAALPFCDELLPAHDFRSLAAVIAELSRSVL
jgi:uncharacterized protein with von Willebrand factor type A (vWA) domain